MAKPKIFVSYSHQNTATQLALIGALKANDFDVRWDAGNTHTPQLHKDISSNLNWADAIVPILTVEWLNSHECRDELVRANERRKTIIPFRHRTVSDDGPPKLPWYLRDMLSVMWDENELPRALPAILQALAEAKPETWKSNCYRDIRQIGDDIQQARSTDDWQDALCQQVMGIAKRQLHDVLATDACSFDISHEHSYLRFAEPIFSQAKTIVAICIASISTFWTNTHFRSDAGRYLKSQRQSAESICRLFVFDSVSEVMTFRPILQHHHETYGKMTDRHGVFLCSTSSYRKLLTRWSRHAEGLALRQDFGLLSFGASQRRMFATLDESEFRYKLYEEDDVEHGSKAIILEHFEAMKALGLGEIEGPTGIARWSPRWGESGEELAIALERLFVDRTAPVTHVVLLQPACDGPEVANYLYQLVARFHAQRATLRLDNVSVTRRSDMAVIDSRFTAPLRLWGDFEYALVMRFDDDSSLRHYYQHELHSFEREKLYRLLNPATNAQFDAAAQLDRTQTEARARIFSAIEREMTQQGFIRRFDIHDDEPLGSVISRLSASVAAI